MSILKKRIPANRFASLLLAATQNSAMYTGNVRSPMPTIKEIAQQARVSTGTVSNVLNGVQSVRPEARERVLKAVKQLGYEPSVLGRALRKEKTHLIVMLVPDITNPFFPGVVRGAEDTAFQNGFRLVLCNSDNDSAKEEVYLHEMLSYRPAGLILVPANLSRGLEKVKAYEQAGSCVVYMDRVPPSWKGNAVTTGHEEGAYVAVRHLIELGHQHIATIAGPLSSVSGAGRLAGYRRAMKEAKLPIDSRYVREAPAYIKAHGHELARQLLACKPRPTAIFAGNDLLAFGALAAIREVGLQCPKDISVVGFDNSAEADDVIPALTTVDQSVYNLGATAATTVIEHARGQLGTVRQVMLPSVLCVKQSSGPPAKPRRR